MCGMGESLPKAVTEQTYMYANYALVFYINPLPLVCTVACDESRPLVGVMTESFIINILSMQRYVGSVFVKIFLLHFLPNTPTPPACLRCQSSSARPTERWGRGNREYFPGAPKLLRGTNN